MIIAGAELLYFVVVVYMHVLAPVTLTMRLNKVEIKGGRASKAEQAVG